MKAQTKSKKVRKSEYDHLTEGLIHLDRAIRELNFVDDVQERFTGYDGSPMVDITDVEAYAEGLREHILKIKKRKNAKSIPQATCRDMIRALDFWAVLPDRMKFQRAESNKREVEIIDADNLEIVLILRQEGKWVRIFGTPHVDERPDYPVTHVIHPDAEDIAGVFAKVQEWVDAEEAKHLARDEEEPKTNRSRRRGESRATFARRLARARSRAGIR